MNLWKRMTDKQMWVAVSGILLIFLIAALHPPYWEWMVLWQMTMVVVFLFLCSVWTPKE